MGGIDVTIIPQQVDLGAEVDDVTIEYSGTPEKLKTIDQEYWGTLGQLKLMDLSITGSRTKANMQSNGWAICDGTTPATQGIPSPTIETTNDMRSKIVRMSSDESSGGTGGADTHNHQIGQNSGTQTYEIQGTGQEHQTYNEAGNPIDWPNGGTTASSWSKSSSTLPAYTEAVWFIKVKL